MHRIDSSPDWDEFREIPRKPERNGVPATRLSQVTDLLLALPHSFVLQDRIPASAAHSIHRALEQPKPIFVIAARFQLTPYPAR
jgi:hypothetical protein